jgi:hypothetical protein
MVIFRIIASLLTVFMVATRRNSFAAKDPPAGISLTSVAPGAVSASAGHDDCDAVTTDQVPLRRATRSAPTPIIRCSDFGPHRNQIYPVASFCSECVWWDAQTASGTMGRAKRTSKTFECKYVKTTKKHKSFMFPYPYDPSNQQDIPKPPRVVAESKKRAASLKKEKYTEVESDDAWSSDDDDTTVCSSEDDKSRTDEQFCAYLGTIIPKSFRSPPPVTVNNPSNSFCSLISNPPATLQTNNDTASAPGQNPTFSTLQKENASLKRQLSENQNKLRSTRRRMLNAEDKLEKKISEPPTNVSARSVVQNIAAHLDEQAARSGKSMQSASQHLVKALLNKTQKGALVGERRKQLLEALRKPVLADYKSDTYTAHACSRLQDMTAGISLQHFDLLKTLESKGKKWAKGGILPSSSSIKRVRKAAERFGRKRIPVRKGTLKNGLGEFFEFDVEELVVYAIKAFGLEQVAKQRAVRISVSIDGAQLSKRLTHVTIGFKIADIAARCPYTGRALFMDTDPALLQSRNLCIPVKIAMCKETKQIYKDEFEGIFERFHLLSDKSENGLPLDSPFRREGFKPIRLALNCDMSATWKVFGIGGAAKVHTLPCHCCAIHSTSLSVPNSVLCTLCLELHPDEENW